MGLVKALIRSPEAIQGFQLFDYLTPYFETFENFENFESAFRKNSSDGVETLSVKLTSYNMKKLSTGWAYCKGVNRENVIC